MTETTESGTEAPAARQAPEEVPRPKGIGPLGWLRWAWRQLTTMRTALILLFLVALGAVPGSILPQRGQAPEKVVAYLDEHKTLGPWLDKFSMFDVFAAPWFAAIYILLFVSLVGCVLPRALKHYQSMRARPPAAPRNLGRLPQSAKYETDASPEDVLAEAAHGAARAPVPGGRLRRRRVRREGLPGRVRQPGVPPGAARAAVRARPRQPARLPGNVLLTEGKTFANSLSLYDQFQPGRAFHGGELAPFTITLDDFKARYETEGDQRGMGTDFNAQIRYRSNPDAEEKPYDLKINHPLKVGGAKVYLLGHGYAPVFTVRDAKGNVAFQDSVPFLEMEPRHLTSEGVVKVPDAEPDQLAFYAILWPTAAASEDGKQIVSAFPAPLRPVITVTAFKGDIGLDSGTPQSVYKLEGIGKTLQPVKGGQKLLRAGRDVRAAGRRSITFDGLKEWTSLSVNHDPGRIPALIAAILAVLGVATSFMVRRRRVWVRASAGEGGRTVVEVGGLTLGNPASGFDDIVAALRGPQDEDQPGPQDEGEPGPQDEPGPEPGESDTDAGQEPGSAPEPKEDEVSNAEFANLSDKLMLTTVVLYIVALVAYAADLGFGRRRAVAVQQEKAEAKVLVGAAGAETTTGGAEASGTEAEEESERPRVDWAHLAVLLNVLGWGAHLGVLVSRGIAADRWPWGNMYEFLTAIAFAAVTAFMIVMFRYRARFLGAFVMLAAVIALGVANIWLYDSVGPVTAALNSYWIALHVTAAIIATGSFTVAGAATILYPVKDRAERRGGVAEGGVLSRLPSIEASTASRCGSPRSPSRSGRPRSSWARSGPTRRGAATGLGPEGDLVLHHLDHLRGLPALPRDRGLEGPQGRGAVADRVRRADVQLLRGELHVLGLHSYA